ncbi:MAG: protein kinase [Clostridia bacterium]|nr:protein kinase [Clostridia bacterium]
MSVVYEGRDVVSGIDVALKVLKSDFSDDEAQVERFKREALNVSTLHHPNIVKVYGIGHFEGCHYIAMEKIDGVTLDELIAQGGALLWQDCVDIARQVLESLCYTHAHGVIHKDIKPQNILVDENKHATLTDFGIAEIGTSSNTIVASGKAFSVYYTSPEQIRNDKVDKRTDIYSLGITLYEMLVGAVPFDGDTNYAIAMRHASENAIPPCLVDESIPRAIRDVVVIATMRDPEKRFQSAEEMLDALLTAEKNPDVVLATDAFMVENGIIPENAEKSGDAADGEGGDGENSGEETGGEGENTEGEVRRKGTVLTVIVYVLAAFLATGLVLFYVNYYLQNRQTASDVAVDTTYIVEDYTGFFAQNVVKVLTDNGIASKIVKVESDIYPSGYVLSQNITPGTPITSGELITLNVIVEKDQEILSDYTGRSLRMAEREIANLGLKVEVVELSGSTASDTILKMKPQGGSTVNQGDTVTLYVSRGNIGDMVEVPDLVNGLNGKLTYEEAAALLASYGLKAGAAYPEPGADLSIYFATPTPTPSPTPEPTDTPSPTPDVTGDPSETPGGDAETGSPEETETPTPIPTPTPTPTATPTPAASVTPGGSLTPEGSEYPSGSPSATPGPYEASLYVTGQYPPAGTMLYKGQTVTLYFYDRKELNRVSVPVKESFECPRELLSRGVINLIKIDFVMENGDTAMTSFSNIKEEDFPLEIDVPFNWGDRLVKMYIYVNDVRNVYEMREVKRTDEQMVPTPVTEETEEPSATPSYRIR